MVDEPKIVMQEQRLTAADLAERVHHFLEEYEETQQDQAAKNELTEQDAPLPVKLEQLKQAILLKLEIQSG